MGRSCSARTTNHISVSHKLASQFVKVLEMALGLVLSFAVGRPSPVLQASLDLALFTSRELPFVILVRS